MIQEMIAQMVQSESGRDKIRHSVVWPLTVRLGFKDPTESPYEILPLDDFWKVVEVCAEDGGIPVHAAFLRLADQKPTLENGHPFLKKRTCVIAL